MCFATAQHAYILMVIGLATLSRRRRAMGLRMLTQRLSKNMVGKCMHVSGGAGEAAAIWKCQSCGSGIIKQGRHTRGRLRRRWGWGCGTKQSYGKQQLPAIWGGNGYSSKLINTKRQCDRMISHAVFPICLSLGLRPWGLGLGRWRGERARACGVYRQQLTSPARFSTKCASLTPEMDIGVSVHGE